MSPPIWLRGVNYCNALLLRIEEIPTNHYFFSFSALGNVNAFLLTKEKSYLDNAQAHVDTYLSRATQGHDVFNQVAWQLVLAKKNQLLSEHPAFVEKVIAASQRFPSSITFQDNISNNWKILQLCAMVTGGQTTIDSTWKNFLKGIQLDDGALVDYSTSDSTAGKATPLTYHAKMAFWLGWLAEQTNDPALREMSIRGARFLSHFVSEEGDCLFFGRTSDSIFGMVHAYALFHYAFDKTSDELFLACAQRVNKRILSLMRRDGSFSPFVEKNVADTEKDFYVHDCVYHAYATAFLSEFASFPNASKKCDLPSAFFYGKSSGLLSWREKDFMFVMSVSGQSAPGQSYFFSDSRYYGMNPLFLLWKGKQIIPSPPLIRRSNTSSFLPSHNGFSLWLQRGNTIGTVRLFDVTNVTQKDSVLRLECKGNVGWIITHPLEIVLRKIVGKLVNKTPDLWYETGHVANLIFTFSPREQKITYHYDLPRVLENYSLVGSRGVSSKTWQTQEIVQHETGTSTSGPYYCGYFSGCAWEGEWHA